MGNFKSGHVRISIFKCQISNPDALRFQLCTPPDLNKLNNSSIAKFQIRTRLDFNSRLHILTWKC